MAAAADTVNPLLTVMLLLAEAVSVLPDASVTRMGGDPKSTSGPLASGQFVGSGPPHARLNASPAVICCDHLIAPVFKSSATMASLVSAGGSE